MRPALLLPLLTVVAALAAAVPAGAGAAAPPPEQRIVGGASAPIAQWPSAAYLAIDHGGGRGVGCTGTVVTAGAVLTAAHCLIDAAGIVQSASAVTVVTGRADLRDGAHGTVHGAVRIAIHPGYDPRTARFDAALVALDTATTAPPIALAAGAAPAPAAAEVAGWGALDGVGTPTAALRSAATTLLPDATCARTLSGFEVATMVCAADLDRRSGSVCHGDSGGPLALRRADGSLVQVGVTSWGSSGCDPRAPQAFVRVSALAGWLAAQLPEMAPPPASADPSSSSDATGEAAGIATPIRGDSAVVARGGSADGRRTAAPRAAAPAKRSTASGRTKRCRARTAARRGGGRGSRATRRRGARVTRCVRRAAVRRAAR